MPEKITSTLQQPERRECVTDRQAAQMYNLCSALIEFQEKMFQA